MQQVNSGSEHRDTLPALAFITGTPAAEIDGYVVLVLDKANTWLVCSNESNRVATIALVADAMRDFTMELARELNGLPI